MDRMAASPQSEMEHNRAEFSEEHSSLEHYSLRWNDYAQSVVASFRSLKEEEDFVDVTLACNSKQFTAHKVVLSACSPYFRQLLKTNPCQHPIIILRDITEEDLKSLLKFMYNGEVRIPEDRMKEFLRTAETLQIRGLTDGGVTREPVGKNIPMTNSVRGNVDLNGASMSPDNFGPSAPKRHRFNGPESRNSPSSSPKSLADWGRRSLEPKTEDTAEADNNNSTPKSESLLSQALEKHSNVSSMYDRHLLRDNGDGRDGDSASDTTSERPESLMDGLIKNSGAESELHRQLSAASPASMGGHLFPPGLEALYRQAGFPSAFLGLAAGAAGGSPGGPVSSMHGLASSVPQVGLQSHAGNPNLAGKLDMMRVRATDPRPCPKCGKIYRSAHTLRTHMEDKHTICPGYRCVLCGTVAKSRNSLHSHMSRQHRGISTKDLPVLPMPSPFDPALASRLLAKAGVKVTPNELAARASPTAPRRSDLPKLDTNLLHMHHHQFPLPPSLPTSMSGHMGRGSHDGNGSDVEDLRVSSAPSPFGSNGGPGGIYSQAHQMRIAQGMLSPKDFAALASAGGAQGAAGMGSALLDTYLSMIAAAGGDSNPMAAALNFQNPASRAAAFAAAAAAASGNQAHNGDGKDNDQRSGVSEDRDDMTGELGSDADNDDLSDNDDTQEPRSSRQSPHERVDDGSTTGGPHGASSQNHATTAASN